MFWHQGPTRHSLLTRPSPTAGSFRAGGPGVWYASDQEQAAWAELFRHFTQDGVDPFEVGRRTGKVTVVDLDVLDLTDPAVRRRLSLEVTDLDGDTYAERSLLLGAEAARSLVVVAPASILDAVGDLLAAGRSRPTGACGPRSYSNRPGRSGWTSRT